MVRKAESPGDQPGSTIPLGITQRRWPRLVNYAEMRRVATNALQRLGVTLDVDLALHHFPIAQRQIVAIAAK